MEGRERERERGGGGMFTCTPVVHDNNSKDMFLCSLHQYWLTLLVAWTNEECLDESRKTNIIN